MTNCIYFLTYPSSSVITLIRQEIFYINIYNMCIGMPILNNIVKICFHYCSFKIKILTNHSTIYFGHETILF